MSSGTAITSSSRRFSSIAALTAAGLLSGVLTATSLMFLDALNPFVGTIFGVAIAMVFSLQRRTWAAGRIIAFIASCVMAYFAAIWSPIGVIYVLRALVNIEDKNVPEIFGPVMFSVAGFVGAFVIMLALLLLFSREKGKLVLVRALLLALPGALLGLVSALAREPVQNTVAHWFSPSASWGWKPEQFYSAYLIWQTGMAFVIATFLPQSSALALSGQPVPMEQSWIKLSLGGKVFAVCMLTGTAVLGFFEVRNHYRETYQKRQIEKSRKQAPSAENLPEVKPRPIDQALIFSETASYAESGAERCAARLTTRTP